MKCYFLFFTLLVIYDYCNVCFFLDLCLTARVQLAVSGFEPPLFGLVEQRFAC